MRVAHAAGSKYACDTALIAGFAAGGCYAVGVFDLLHGPIASHAFMAFGPLLTVSAYGMHAHFRRHAAGVVADLAHLMLGIAGVVFCLMATMQQSIHALVPRYHRESPGPDAQTWDAVLRSVSSTQLGLDYAFDLFVSSAVFLLALHMLLHRSMSRALAVSGITIGLAGLSGNAAAFPDNPEANGGLDPAPAFAAWFALLWLSLLRARLRARVCMDESTSC